MITFGLIRHGATEWNQLGKLQGQINTNLVAEGRLQAHQLGKRLQASDWDYIVSSDLNRAWETARIISQESGIVLQGSDERLRERSFGQLEGTTLDERIQRFGADWRTLKLDVESDESVFARWQSFAEDHMHANDDRSILVVAHGSFIGTVLRVLNLEQPDGYLTNTSLTIIRQEEGQWRCLLYSCTAHLD